MKLYKLTDDKDQTFGGCQWGENVTIKTSGEGYLCGPGWTHWYTDPFLAVLLNPIHIGLDLSIAHLWEGEGEIGATDYGLMVGCTLATTKQRISLPKIIDEQMIRFAIRCFWSLCDDINWRSWARKWINGTDRSFLSAWAFFDKTTIAPAGTAWAGAAAAMWSDRTAWEAAVKGAWTNALDLKYAAAMAATSAAVNSAKIAVATATEVAEIAGIAFVKTIEMAMSCPLAEYAAWAVSDESLPD
jgi:hypothetical protein